MSKNDVPEKKVYVPTGTWGNYIHDYERSRIRNWIKKNKFL